MPCVESAQWLPVGSSVLTIMGVIWTGLISNLTSKNNSYETYRILDYPQSR